MSGGSDPIESQKKKYKSRMKKICCCGVVWFLLGLLFFITAIALLASFAKYWQDDKDWRRGLAFTGVAFILIGLLMATIGIIFCIVLYMFYRRLSGDHTGKPHFKPPVYSYGQAPYPQQPPSSHAYSQVDTGTTTGPSSVAPSAPAPGNKPSHPGDVNIEIAEHTKF